jgi:type I restriction enzyme S subunit
VSGGKDAACAAGAGRHKAYPAYRDSGVEWMGEIPAHWEVKRLRRVFQVFNGSTPSSGEPAFWEGEIPWVTPEDLGDLNDRTITSTKRSITEAGYHSCGTILVQAGSLVLSTRAPIGHVALAGINLCTNQGCRSLVFRDCVSSEFHYYELLAARPELESLGQGSTFRELAKGMLEDVELTGPPEREQRAIAAFLDRETARIDALVAKKVRLIELLQEERTALITRAVTKGREPNVPMKDSGVEWLGEIPAHWEVKKVKRLCLVRRGASPRPIDDPIYFDDEGEYAWVRIADVTASERYLERTTQRLSPLGKSKSVALEPGELFVSIAATVGKPVITKIKCCIHDGFVYFVGLHANREFLFYLLSCGEPYKGLGKLGTQLNLNTDTIGDIYLPRPSGAEQEAIVEFLDHETARIDALVSKVRDAIDRLKELRTALISAAVTGKIDVRD